ncbi:conserved hypothetical protein [Theileria equi strain WA]|uniref:CRAL-TRIO domain-containing protein n=1 Tax=Theileria equi strain WA TaxID=1537102 RepID=L1LAY5_THEEQ|nr:conserved hypothetical protein [Theileria equi strain WA]EKX72617.1 conserved hypothetical protein [Theileria equi strain WA]|eukprot:XP_004832069.1 conserved hypothetical protein [Theileria equi strain WA]
MFRSSEKRAKNFATDLTPEELEGLVQALSEEQKALLHEIKQTFMANVYGNELLFDDLFFVRFLRARSFDLKKTTVMLNKYFAWRTETDVPRIITTDMTEIREKLRVHHPHAYHGVDKMGRPIYIERIGLSNPSKALHELSTQQLTEYYVQRYEYLSHVMLPAASLKSGKRVEQLLTILDLRGFQMSQINTKLKAFLSAMTLVTQNYYPELLGKLLFVNTPGMFSALWAIFSGLLDKKTLGKITVISSKTESRAKILELVEPDQLPEFLGGTQPDDTWQTSHFGPWGDEEIIKSLRDTNPHLPLELFELKCL